MPSAVRGFALAMELFQPAGSRMTPPTASTSPQPVTQSASSSRPSEHSTVSVTSSPGSKLSKSPASPADSAAVSTRLSRPMGTLPPSSVTSVTSRFSSQPSVSSSSSGMAKRTNQPSPEVRVETVEKYSLKRYAPVPVRDLLRYSSVYSPPSHERVM